MCHCRHTFCRMAANGREGRVHIIMMGKGGEVSAQQELSSVTQGGIRSAGLRWVVLFPPEIVLDAEL